MPDARHIPSIPSAIRNIPPLKCYDVGQDRFMGFKTVRSVIPALTLSFPRRRESSRAAALQPITK